MSNLLGPRDANGIPVPMTVDESIASMKASLLKKIKRSAYVYRVDCGGCNGCEIEIFATLSPLFDAERFGIKVVPSPRHADILLFTGAVTRAMRSPALRAWQSAPDPKICISYGACGNSGGIFHDLYCVWGGTDKIVPVDVYIPGCPPTPAATLYGFAMALGLLEQKIHARGMNIWHGLPLWRRAVKPAVKWKACRSTVRSSSTLTMCRCWLTHSIKPGQRKLRSRKNGVPCC